MNFFKSNFPLRLIMSKSKAFILNIIFLGNGNEDWMKLQFPITFVTLKGKQVMIQISDSF